MLRLGRLLVLAAVLLGAVSSTAAQPTAPPWRIGLLMPERPGALEALLEGFRALVRADHVVR